MKELVLATGNRHKVEEIRHILKSLPVIIRDLSEFDPVPEIIEDGETLRENAIKKARTVALALKAWALADDTGLEVDFLHGKPGVYSARWAGPGCSYADNNRKLLVSLKGVPRKKRKARFSCVIAVANPRGKAWTVEGSVSGIITEKPRGKNGFGYDPLFLVPACNKTFAELGADVKNGISHRARALRKAKRLIRELASEKRTAVRRAL